MRSLIINYLLPELTQIEKRLAAIEEKLDRLPKHSVPIYNNEHIHQIIQDNTNYWSSGK